MFRAFGSIVAVAIAAISLVASPSLAQTTTEPGVTVDPNSPAGKEYALPVDTARREAQGHRSGRASSSAVPLFGDGVGPSSRKGAAGPAAPVHSKRDSGRASTVASAPSKQQARVHPKRDSGRASMVASAASKQQTLRRTAVPTRLHLARIAAAANENPAGSGFGSTLTIGAVGFAVLLLGGLGGLALRRMRT